MRDATRQTDTEESAPRGWPVLHVAAMHGFAAEFLRVVSPQSESDPVALLLQLLVMFGAAVGRKPRTVVESTPHRTRLFLALIGQSSAARKGTAFGHIEHGFRIADESWAEG